MAEPDDEQPGISKFRYVAVGRWIGMTPEQIEANIQRAEEGETERSQKRRVMPETRD